MAKGNRGGQNSNRVAKTIKKVDEVAKVVNPNYNKGKPYRINCQRCVVAYEMQRRGVNAEALPNNGGKKVGFTDVFGFDPNDHNNYYSSSSTATRSYYDIGKKWDYHTQKFVISNPNTLGRGATNVATNIENAMAKWGDGSRAVMFVVWKGSSSAHVINVEQIGGKTYIIDAQNGKSWTGHAHLVNYLKNTTANCTELYRVDNLPVKGTWQQTENTAQNTIYKINKKVKKG